MSKSRGRRSSTAWCRRVLATTLVAGAVVLGVTLVPAADAATAGLVAAYGFNEGSGSSVSDASGTGNAGSVTGATWSAEGKFGSSLSFDGKSSWVSVADSASLRLTTGMTVEAWVKPSSTTGGWRTVMMKERAGGMSYALYGMNNSGKPPAVYGSIGGSDSSAGDSKVLTVNAWSHVAGTYDGSTLRVYVNGVLVGSQAVKGSFAASTSPLRIGGNAAWGEYFAGLIDDVRVYNRALSAAEVSTDMNTPVS